MLSGHFGSRRGPDTVSLAPADEVALACDMSVSWAASALVAFLNVDRAPGSRAFTSMFGIWEGLSLPKTK